MKAAVHPTTHRNWTVEVHLTRVLFGLTLIAGGFLYAELIGVFAGFAAAGAWWAAAEHAVFMAAIGSFLYGGIVYQMARLGFLRRSAAHRRGDEAVLGAIRAAHFETPPVAILIPSYKEELSVVRQTLLSAALQDYPNRRVMLLIDDPPHSRDPESQRGLQRMRDLPHAIAAALDEPNQRFSSALADHLQRKTGKLDPCSETLLLAALHAEAARWFEARAAEEPQNTHTDRLFVRLALSSPAFQHRNRSDDLAQRAEAGAFLEETEMLDDFRSLATRFCAEIGSFERKCYENLSWEPNKAMNLNAYIGLLGGSYREEESGDGLRLEPFDAEPCDLFVPAADYLVTLDADSLLAHDYVLRLVEVMERPENQRVAIAQTPYSAVPEATGAVERIAGATTDIQYIVHQGFTQHDATYWVGANALIRTRALEDIRTERNERGFRVPLFIQDRTVIEDSESTVDLIACGWALHNEPERLAFSATPPDFGALTIQRRRWANGGLIILPKLLRHALSRRPTRKGLVEFFMRFHYLTSIALVNSSLVLLLAVPFEDALRSWWLPMASIPYFVLYTRDLCQEGYRKGDVLRAYALNLLLVPVNLAGVGRSIVQFISGRKSSFGRTPKVANRIGVSAGILLSAAALFGICTWRIGSDLQQGMWFHAAFLLVNGSLLGYGLLRFIGVRAFIQDVSGDLADRWDDCVQMLSALVLRARTVEASITER